jgi:hypothetical protein
VQEAHPRYWKIGSISFNDQILKALMSLASGFRLGKVLLEDSETKVRLVPC